MKLRLALLAAAALPLVGCEDRSAPTVTKPDNSGVNARDREGTTKTPPDQAEGTEADRNLTAEVRRAITADSTLSMNAKNIKIITLSGVVTLRGPVESQAEKDAIAAKAGAVAGVKSVDNQLEVKKP